MCSIFFNTTKKKQIRLIHEAVNFADNKTTVSLKSLTFNLTKKLPQEVGILLAEIFVCIFHEILMNSDCLNYTGKFQFY